MRHLQGIGAKAFETIQVPSPQLFPGARNASDIEAGVIGNQCRPNSQTEISVTRLCSSQIGAREGMMADRPS